MSISMRRLARLPAPWTCFIGQARPRPLQTAPRGLPRSTGNYLSCGISGTRRNSGLVQGVSELHPSRAQTSDSSGAAPTLNVRVYGRRARGSAARRLSRISTRPLPLVLASVAFRRIHKKTGVSQDIHAHDHVISHVFAIGDRHGDIELSPRNDDSSVYHISFFRLVRCGRANTDSIEDGAEARPRREVRVEAGPCRAGIDPRQHPDVALAPAEGDLLDDADARACWLLPPLGDHGVHRQLPSRYRYTSRDIALTAPIADSTRFSPANRIASFRGCGLG